MRDELGIFFCGVAVMATLFLFLIRTCDVQNVHNLGGKGQECFPNDTCLDGFECRSGLCVELGHEGGGDGSAQDPGERDPRRLRGLQGGYGWL